MKTHLLLSPLVALALAGFSSAAEFKAPVPPDNVEFRENVEYGKGGEKTLHMHLALPKEESKNLRPVIVFIHGGGWSKGSRDVGIPVIFGAAKSGYVGASIEYRFSQEATFPAQIEDCKCAIRFLRAHAAEYHLDPERIGVWGPSAGGHLVALLGTTAGVSELEGRGGWEKFSSRVQAVCDWFGPTDFLTLVKESAKTGRGKGAESPVLQLIGGPLQENLEKAKQASPINHVSKNVPPFLIMHGEKDTLVPVEQSEMFASALKKAGVDVTLHVIPGAGHGGPGFNTEEVNREVLGFFDKHLKPPAKTAS